MGRGVCGLGCREPQVWVCWGSCGWKHLGCCPRAERPVIASSRMLAVPDTRCEAAAAAANLKGRELDREGWKTLGAAEEVGANRLPPPPGRSSPVRQTPCAPSLIPQMGLGLPAELRGLAGTWDLSCVLSVCQMKPCPTVLQACVPYWGSCEVLGVFGSTAGNQFLGGWRGPLVQDGKRGWLQAMPRAARGPGGVPGASSPCSVLLPSDVCFSGSRLRGFLSWSWDPSPRFVVRSGREAELCTSWQPSPLPMGCASWPCFAENRRVLCSCQNSCPPGAGGQTHCPTAAEPLLCQGRWDVRGMHMVVRAPC